jgi:biotin carboxyl carrier protein
MIYTVKINDKEYEVEVEQGKATLVKTSAAAPAASAPVPAAQPAAPAPAAPAPAAAPGGGEIIKAPMPGTVMEIKPVGTHVKKGEILLIFEAMKMENEVFAPYDAVVSQVFVAKNAAIETGDALLAIQ